MTKLGACISLTAHTVPADLPSGEAGAGSGPWSRSRLRFEIGAHALRATAATNALDHQADIAKVQEWLGHANIATTRIYDHASNAAGGQPDFQSGLLMPMGEAQPMSALESIAWPTVRSHYDERMQMHGELLALREKGNTRQFVNLLLGVSNPAGNYSAEEHALGPKILAENVNAEGRVADLGEKFIALKTAREVPLLIRAAQLRYLQIGVGSEASCMLNPKVCWVANTRTIWTHLVIKHADDFEKANEELKLYRNADVTSEMAYQMWAHIHRELATSMTRIAEEGEKLAVRAKTSPGEIKYLWADAIANALYDDHHK